MSDINYSLNPCPFCGADVKMGNRKWLAYDKRHDFSVSCTCGASGQKADSKEKAIVAWNVREYAARDMIWNPFDFREDNVGLSGNLKSVDFSCILQILCSENKTGILKVSHGQKMSAFCLKEGQVIAASSNYRPQLGHILFNKGLITLEKIQKVLQKAKSSGKRMGEMLLDMGYIKQDTLKGIISEQINETVQGVVLWANGDFQFRDCPVEFDERGVENISVMGLMLDAFRNVDESAEAVQ